ncbi:MAG: hypothetical protein CM15mP18_3460 [Methanobacteriota archaeon]|nr:MAG: hypothetical protein CM15mP18_3460 [Euryarchaeota archaeon]
MSDEAESPAPEEETPERGENRQPIVSGSATLTTARPAFSTWSAPSAWTARPRSWTGRRVASRNTSAPPRFPAAVLNDPCAAMMGGKASSPRPPVHRHPWPPLVHVTRSRGAVGRHRHPVVDIMEGLQPKPSEPKSSVARGPLRGGGQQIDRLHGWSSEQGRAFIASFHDQRKDVQALSRTASGSSSACLVNMDSTRAL